MATFSERLKEAMLIRGMKNTELARKSELSKGTISNYLAGRYEAKQDNVYKLALALDVDEGWLMGFDIPMQRRRVLPYGLDESYQPIKLAYTDEEIRLLNAFRSLSPDLRKSVLKLLESYRSED